RVLSSAKEESPTSVINAADKTKVFFIFEAPFYSIDVALYILQYLISRAFCQQKFKSIFSQR
ncbi:MAG: hypothetical protein IJM48_03780, partial [Treponema sp.]|nr:hypothetical protein [Treponema sp.]